jgi:restriction system protein
MQPERDGAGEEGMSLINRFSAKGSDVMSAGAADDMLAISGLSRIEVELRVTQAYRRQGYQVATSPGPAADPDAGIVLTNGGQRVVLQCKYWKTCKLAEMPVRELYGLMAAQGANAGILITAGSFTLEASRFAGYGRIQLIDGPRVLALLREEETAERPAGRSAEHAQRANSAGR